MVESVVASGLCRTELLGAGSTVYAVDGDASALRVLSELVKELHPGGRVIVVEYDRRAEGRWAPYRIPAWRWPQLAEAAGLTEPTIAATKPSYSGVLSTGVATRSIASA